MPFLIRKPIRVAVLGCACWTVCIAVRADEELPAPEPVPADELALPKNYPAERFAHPLRTSNADAESPSRMLEESPDVQEFARRLNEQLNAEEPGKPAKLRSGRTGLWNPGALNRDTCAGNCPICGSAVKGRNDLTFEKALGGRSPKPAAHWLFEQIDVGELPGDETSKGEAKLTPGEPAQVIMELRERLGTSALEGSEFTVKPDALAKLIRALDREAQQEEQDSFDRAPLLEPLPSALAEPAENHDAAISALRMASRQLDEAADVLEEQNLFERADQLRGQADQLRRDARTFLQEELVPYQTAPVQQTSIFLPPENGPAEANHCESERPEFNSVFRPRGCSAFALNSLSAWNLQLAKSVERMIGDYAQILGMIDYEILRKRKDYGFHDGVEVGFPITR